MCDSKLNTNVRLWYSVCAGELPDLAHDVQGKLCFKDKSTVVIKNFYYDSQGPGLYRECTSWVSVYVTIADGPLRSHAARDQLFI